MTIISSLAPSLDPSIKQPKCLVLERASVTRRRTLATSDKELESQWDKDVEVKKLDFQSCAKAHCSFKFSKPLQHRAALVHCRVTQPNVDQPAQKIHTSTQFQCVNGACALGSRTRFPWRWRAWCPWTWWIRNWWFDNGRYCDWWFYDGRDCDWRDFDARWLDMNGWNDYRAFGRFRRFNRLVLWLAAIATTEDWRG